MQSAGGGTAQQLLKWPAFFPEGKKMDNTTLLVLIVVLIVLFGGGGGYFLRSRGRG